MATVSDTGLLGDPSILAKVVMSSPFGGAIQPSCPSWRTFWPPLPPFTLTPEARRPAAAGAARPAKPPSLAEAYSTLHEAEEKIREELLQQLQYLQEEAERIGEDLSHGRQATVKPGGPILRCPYGSCPVRGQLQTP